MFLNRCKANPKVELSVADTQGNWLRVAGTIVVDPSTEAKQKMLDSMPSLKDLYSIDDGIMEVFYLKDAVATFWSFTAEPRTVQL